MPEIPRFQSTYKPYIFSDGEFAAIIHAADNFQGNVLETASSFVFPVLLRILYGCGLRLGEGLLLRWQNINLDTGVITIFEAKNNRQRIVPMSNSLTELLKLFCQKNAPESSDYLFESPRRNREPYRECAFRFWFAKILEQAGIQPPILSAYDRGICPHCLRHLFVHKSFLKSEAEGRRFEETVPFLSEYLGHQSLYETDKYLNTDYTIYTASHQRMNKTVGDLFPEVVFE